jgi:hypothetical protein
MALPEGYSVEVVRGRIDDALARDLVRFWTSYRVMSPNQAQERLKHVVCVLRDAGNNLAGVNSVDAREVELIGNRRLWVYKSFIPNVSPSLNSAMLQSALDALNERYDGGEKEPKGVCVLITDRELMKRFPEAIWPGSGLMFAGYTREGAQARVRWFDGARI